MKQEKDRRAAFNELRSPLTWWTQATHQLIPMHTLADERENRVWEPYIYIYTHLHASNCS